MTRFTSRFIGMLVAVFALSFMLAAQPQRMTPQERTDRLAKDLKLSDEQKTKVLDIFTKSQDSMKKAFDENQGDQETMRPLMQKIRQNTDDQLKKVLTDEQYEKYTSQRANFQRGNRANRPQPMPSDSGKSRPRPTPPDSSK
jgi:periplasmic protein CpxP/Spy